jgi:hypothetical protein
MLCGTPAAAFTKTSRASESEGASEFFHAGEKRAALKDHKKFVFFQSKFNSSRT